MDVDLEVAALIAARQSGVDVGPFLVAAKRKLRMA
jgi:hypothetical protein